MFRARLVAWCAHAAAAAGTLLALGCTDEPYRPSTGAEGETWSSLVEASWSLPGGDESYTCARITIERDMYVRGFRAKAPLGTHHTVLSLEAGGEPDGTFECHAAQNGQNMLFGSGVGTAPVRFPEGVAIKLEQGSAVLLNLHLFNVANSELTGTSGIEVLGADASEVEHEAEIVLAGTRDLAVTPGVSTAIGNCEMSHDVTVFSVFPHMHQLGSHLKATAEPASGSPHVLVDTPYSFESQRYYDVTPSVVLAKGDRVSVECQYDNPGSETVGFGDSSFEEMCFVGLFRYPKSEASGMVCASDDETINLPPCAEPGAPGNEVGVGKECSKGGGECGGDAQLCIADYTEGDFGNFCTTLCTSDDQCGSGASCLGDSPKVCVPNGCVGG